MFYLQTSSLPNRSRKMHISARFERRIAWREFAPSFIVVFNSLVWYILVSVVFNNAVNSLSLPINETLAIFTLHYAGVACSAVIGAAFFSRARKTHLATWIATGALTTALLATIAHNSTPVNMGLSLLLGVSIGAGLPSSLAYFADSTFVENRGTYGGITYAAVGFTALAIGFPINAINNAVLSFAILAIWRACGLGAFILSSRGMEDLQERKHVAYGSILRRRDVVLYLIPWIMFSLVNFAEAPMLKGVLGDFYDFAGLVEVALSGIFVLLGGFFADLTGRKRVVITGFIVLGIEYAMLSLLSGIPISWYAYTVLDSFAWGMFASVFFMTLWGDLAENNQKDKYYALGGLPYLFAGLLPMVIKPFVNANQAGTAFSLASFFLFLAVLPLMYAPETLPEKRIRERELKEYLEKAKRTKEKYA
jgi:MFS family permease